MAPAAGDALGIDKALEAGDDIVGGHGAAVVELDALAEREGPDLAAFGRLPRGREHGAERRSGSA